MDNTSLHIVFASDDNFVLQLQVAVISFLKACEGDAEPWIVDILDCGIKDETWRGVIGTVDHYAKRFSVKYSVARHKIDMRAYEGYSRWNTSRATYARLELPNLLKDANYCIYSDCDMLFIDNPRVLVRQLVTKTKTILGHRNPVVRGKDSDGEWFRANGLPYDKENHFCAGLVAMNLEKMRMDDAVHKLHSFMRKFPSPVSVDQSALNWYCSVSGKSGGVFDGTWGLFPSECFGIEPSIISAIHLSCGHAWKGSPSWYEYLTMHRVDSLWIQFASALFPDQNIHNKTRFAVTAVAFVAACVARLILALRIPLPRKKDFLEEMRKVFTTDDGIEATRKKLMDGV